MVGRPFGIDEPEDNNVTPLEGFAKRQAAVRATRYLAAPVQALGSSMVAYGLSPRPTTYISHVRRQTAYDRRMQTGKGFANPYTDSSGRTFSKGLGKESPTSSRHGYNTGSRHTRNRKRIRSRTLTVAGGGLYGLGKALPIIGYGYVAYSLYDDYRAGRIEKPSDASRQIQDYTLGTNLDEIGALGKRAFRVYKTYSPTAIAARGIGEAAKKAAEVMSSLR